MNLAGLDQWFSLHSATPGLEDSYSFRKITASNAISAGVTP